MDKIKKTNMNIKKITIAMLITLISIGNINAQEMKTEIPKISEFPTGNENTGFEQYFSGKSWLAPLTSNKDLNVPMFNVTFEPHKPQLQDRVDYSTSRSLLSDVLATYPYKLSEIR